MRMELKSFFNPSSIAIVGASHKKNKVGYLTVKNLLEQGYKGKITLVNNKYQGEILKIPTANQLTPVDLVVFAIPSEAIFSYLDDMKRLSIKNAIVFSAGFKEIGGKGVEKESLLSRKAEEYQIKILGPNCIGYVNTKKNINLTFLKDTVPSGNIGFISQSGALGSALLDYSLAHKNLGFSYFISLGNETVLDESDALNFLINDKSTKVIALYLEGVKNGPKFKKTLAKATKFKPVIILKSGKTDKGSKAVLSHTGSIVGNDNFYQAMFYQYGAIRADSYTEFLTLLKIFSYQRIPSNHPVLVLSNAGGPGVLLTDELVENKVPLTRISPSTKKKILKKTSYRTEKITIHNPIDLLGDASAFDYQMVIEETIKERNIGSIIILLTPQANTQIEKTARIIIELQSHLKKPLYPVFMGERSLEKSVSLFEKSKIVHFSKFDSLVRPLAKIINWQQYREDLRSQTGQVSLKNLKRLQLGSIGGESTPKNINLYTVFNIFKKIGLPVADYYLIDGNKYPKNKISYPLVAKVSSEKIIHKTEIGGVITNIYSKKQLDIAIKKLSFLDPEKIIIQKMLQGTEIFIGAKKDRLLGTIILLGIGGIFTELFREISYGLYPLSYPAFLKMFEKTKLDVLSAGFRKQPSFNKKHLYEILNKVGNLISQNELIKEIDINPLIASKQGLLIVDGRIIISQN